MSDFLAAMTESSLGRARVARDSLADLKARASRQTQPIPLDLSAPGFDVIAEVKLASPSAGRLVDATSTVDVISLARAFQSRGAAAISVLTEPTSFQGSIEHLEEISRNVPIPVMRKDFLVDPIQVLEARAAGASGVLLIARILPGRLLEEMTDLVLELGMFALIEVFDISDLECSVRVFDRPVLVGVNCRDLAGLGLDPGRFAKLAPRLPDHLPAVAESGLSGPADASRVASLGYRAALLGSSLVSAPGPEPELERFISAGRRALTGAGR